MKHMRMTWFLRILCAMLAGFMLISCLSACQIDPDDEIVDQDGEDDQDDKDTEKDTAGAKETDPADTDPATDPGTSPEESETDPANDETEPETKPGNSDAAYDVGTWPSRTEKEVDLYNNGYNTNLIVGFDEQGRVVTPVGNEIADREVGMFYHVWHGAHTTGLSDNFDMTKIREQYGDDALFNRNETYSPENNFHWWGQPLWGYYNSGDEWVIRKHLELLTSAGVDFVVFDYTNGTNYNGTVKRFMKVVSELRSEGWDAPQVVFFTHAYSIQTMRNVYENLYAKNEYPDSWYCVDGKPMIIGYTDLALDQLRTEQEMGLAAGSLADAFAAIKPLSAKEKSFFYFRSPAWPYDDYSTVPQDGWPYLDWCYPQRLYGDMMAVSVSAHPHCPFSQSLTVGRDKNWGRGYNVSTHQNVAEDVMKGTFFQSEWNTVRRRKPRFIMITGWNEWIAIKLPSGGYFNANYQFVDCVDMEFSRDIEPMVGGYEDAYYIQTITNIRKYAYESLDGKIAKTVKKVIDVNGAATQWDDVNAVYRRIGTDDGRRNAKDACKQNWYKQDPARNNLVEVRVTVDSENVYFYIKATEDIVLSDDANWMNIFIGKGSTPNSRNGWEGYEYVINRSRENGKATIEKLNADYTGKTLAAKAEYSVQGNVMQVSVPRATLGVTDAEDFFFKVADGVTDPAEIMNYYNTGRSMPMGRLSYLYQIGNAN